jgi:hypothetical protein
MNIEKKKAAEKNRILFYQDLPNIPIQSLSRSGKEVSF